MSSEIYNIDSGVLTDGCSSEYIISAADVANAIGRLKSNKNYGCSNLSTNHFKSAGTELLIHTACLFSGFFSSWSCASVFLLEHC
jgi:hypothetical protein